MTSLNEANEVLSDPEKRKVYDQIGHQAWAKGARSAEDVRPPPGWNQGYEQSAGPSGFGQDRSEFLKRFLVGRPTKDRDTNPIGRGRALIDGTARPARGYRTDIA